MPIKMQYRQDLDFVLRNNLQIIRSPKQSCFPQFCQKPGYSPPKPGSQITLILLKWCRTLKGIPIFSFVLASCMPLVRATSPLQRVNLGGGAWLICNVPSSSKISNSEMWNLRDLPRCQKFLTGEINFLFGASLKRGQEGVYSKDSFLFSYDWIVGNWMQNLFVN